MSVEKQGKGRRMPLGIVCEAVEVRMSRARVEVVWTVVSQAQKVHSEEEDGLVCLSAKICLLLPSLKSSGDQPSGSVRRPTESRNLAPLQTILTRGFFSSHI